MFKIVSSFVPRGDQPKAIDLLVKGIKENKRFQVLLGVTGSGKSFTMAHVIQRIGKPALIISPNKTLASQLYTEFKNFFPENAVEFFVSYYDYYQPEAYLPEYDLYIEKDAILNEEIDRMRHSTTMSLCTRQDVIVVASVSCIYNIGSPENYYNMRIELKKGEKINFQSLLKKLIMIGYKREDLEFSRSSFRVRGDFIDIFPPYEENSAIRLGLFGDDIEEILSIEPLNMKVMSKHDKITLFPGNHYIAPEVRIKRALQEINHDLEKRVKEFESMGKTNEAQRLKARTLYDIELIQEIGYCKGIENYSRYFDGRAPGEPPFTLLDYFPEDFIIFIDESHITIPQIQSMHKGDRSRKESLVEWGFRLPSAFDNRPLTFEEFLKYVKNAVFVSATPAQFELSVQNNIVEQIVRPTGIPDPPIEVRSAIGQVDDVLLEIERVIKKGERAFVMTLTKKQAEQLSEHLQTLGIKARYLHSEIETLERFDIIRDLRMGVFDVLVGINLLREGLDVPEVALVAILDADREGFLRSERSIIQLAGRASRNIDSKIILYADRDTPSIKRAVEEMRRRREIQIEYNKKNGITPETVRKAIFTLREEAPEEKDWFTIPTDDIHPSKVPEVIKELQKKMKEFADRLEFEEAVKIRDKIKELKNLYMKIR